MKRKVFSFFWKHAESAVARSSSDKASMLSVWQLRTIWSSLYSHSSCKFTLLVSNKLDYCNSLYSGVSQTRSQQTSTHSKFIGTCHYKYFKISTHHTNTQKTTLANTSYKESITNSVFSHTKHKSTTYISLQ